MNAQQYRIDENYCFPIYSPMISIDESVHQMNATAFITFSITSFKPHNLPLFSLTFSHSQSCHHHFVSVFVQVIRHFDDFAMNIVDFSRINFLKFNVNYLQ